ncbi:unnamed protein product, partial [Adineta steineri]
MGHLRTVCSSGINKSLIFGLSPYRDL